MLSYAEEPGTHHTVIGAYQSTSGKIHYAEEPGTHTVIGAYQSTSGKIHSVVSSAAKE